MVAQKVEPEGHRLFLPDSANTVNPNFHPWIHLCISNSPNVCHHVWTGLSENYEEFLESLQEMLKHIISETGFPRSSNLTQTNADSNLLIVLFKERYLWKKTNMFHFVSLGDYLHVCTWTNDLQRTSKKHLLQQIPCPLTHAFFCFHGWFIQSFSYQELDTRSIFPL